MIPYVVDASVVAKWFFHEKYREFALKLKQYSDRLFAPDYFLVEFGSLLAKKVRLAEANQEQAYATLETVKVGPIQFQNWRSGFERAFELSLSVQQSFYDCLYLSLAEELDGQFVTADQRFLNGLPEEIRENHCLWIEEIPSE